MYDTAGHIAQEIVKIGPFHLFFDGDSKKGIPGVSWTLEGNPGWSLFDLSDRLRTRGWQAAAYTMLPNITDVVVMRVLVRHGFTRDMADLFLADVKRSIDYLEAHKPATPLGAAGQKTPHHAFSKDTVPAKAP